jgi:hypothetical protein
MPEGHPTWAPLSVVSGQDVLHGGRGGLEVVHRGAAVIYELPLYRRFDSFASASHVLRGLSWLPEASATGGVMPAYELNTRWASIIWPVITLANGCSIGATLDGAGDRRPGGRASRGRNAALNHAAWTLGRWIAAGALEQRDVEDALYAAAGRNGLVAEDSQRQTWATIRSGLGAGRRGSATPAGATPEAAPRVTGHASVGHSRQGPWLGQAG